MLVGSVDSVVIPTGNINPKIARDGDKRDLSIVGTQDGNHHCVGAEGCAGTYI